MRKAIIYGIIIFQIALIGSLIRNIQLSIRARYRVRDLQARKEELGKEQEGLKEELAYVGSDYYVEKVAREELQLGKTGETVVIIPKGSIEVTENQGKEEEEEIPNYLKWWQVFKGES